MKTQTGSQNIHIQKMRLQLPAGYEHRGEGLARRVADRLSQLTWDRPVNRQSVAVPPLEMKPGESEAVLALRIADAVYQRLR